MGLTRKQSAPPRKKASLVSRLSSTMTDLRNTELACTLGDKRLELLVRNLPLMLHAHDEAGGIVFWSQECERVLGYTAQEAMLANLDREVVGHIDGPGVLEIKTAGYHSAPQWEEGIPVAYQCQVLHQLAVTGHAIQQIKPVMMMSPMSIANFLPPGQLEFDVVIFDEASQVKTVDAFGAILRGRQVIVVGDTRQMPPSDFFGRDIALEDEDSVTADIESVLSMFKMAGAQERYLRWHYRSRHGKRCFGTRSGKQ